MKKSKRLIKEMVINFFQGNLLEMKSINSLSTMLGYYSLEMSGLGVSAINRKYGCKYPYLIAADENDSEMIIFVYSSISREEKGISMYCVLGDSVYLYRNEQSNVGFSKEDWYGKLGSKMIKIAIEFKDEIIPKSLVLVSEGLGNDIVKFTRNLSIS
jgi:hypothetical protein